MFSLSNALGPKSKTEFMPSRSRDVRANDVDYCNESEDALFRTFHFRSLTLDPWRINKEESFYSNKNFNDNYTKPIRFYNLNRRQTVARAKTAFTELVSPRRNSRLPSTINNTIPRRFPTQTEANHIFLTQGERSRETTSVSSHERSKSPLPADDVEDEILESEKQKLDVDDIKRRLYQKECSKVGVTPVGKFLRSPTQLELSFRYYNLGSGGAKALSVPLMLDSTMTKLDLEGNAIGDEGITNMAEMLEEHCSINTMILNRNNLSSKSAYVLCKVLLHNRHIRTLSLSANNFDDKVGQIFADMLKENRELRCLDLSENSLGEASGKALGDALSHNETLERLNLAWNKFRLKGAAKLLDGVKENVGLKWLNLSYNSLSRGPSKSSPDSLGNALSSNNTLKHIELSSTQLNDLDILGLAKGLKNNESLNTVKVGRNLVQHQSISALLKAIVVNELSKITLLDMEDMAIEEAALEDIETLQARGVKVIHGPVHQSETKFHATPSSIPAKQSDNPNNNDGGTIVDDEKGMED